MKKLFVLIIAVVGIGASSIALAAPARNTSGVVYASALHTVGSDLYVSGDFKDKILGRGAIVYVTKVGGSNEPSTVTVKAKQITIYTRKGSLRGTGKAKQTFNADGTATIKDGTFNLNNGTGAYKGHKFSGTFSGDFKNDVYKFEYKAKYK